MSTSKPTSEAESQAGGERRTLITLDGVRLSLGGKRILDGINLTVSRGEIVTLIGPNGSGKTTLVRVLLGLLSPDRGSVRPAGQLTVGYVPQNMAVEDVLPLTVGRFLTLTTLNDTNRCQKALDEVGAGRLLKLPIQAISGGELRRVLLARALLRDPDLLVLDEPTQGVDVTGQFELYELIGQIRDDRNCGVLLVSHDLHVVMAATDRVVCLNHHVCCSGTPEAVTNDPAYFELFGAKGAEALAVYSHHHDHHHHIGGNVVAAQTGEHDHD
ncbi:MAG: zinc ABC transporter ATP-binding protein ZnuC [Sphingomonadales bacterium]